MTLGGLAAAVGLVIDDAIVVVENIVMHRDTGQSRTEAIRSAIREISVPLVGSTITPIVVFLPLISITGVTGVFFRALAITVAMALLTSLALALTWTPTLSLYLVRRSGGKGVEGHERDGLSRPRDRRLRTGSALGAGAPLGAACCDGLGHRRFVLLLPGARLRTCCRTWTKADSSSTTSCPPAPRSRTPTT